MIAVMPLFAQTTATPEVATETQVIHINGRSFLGVMVGDINADQRSGAAGK